ncbi:carboxylesterase-like protein 1, partial [Dinothrombium tinctorium]
TSSTMFKTFILLQLLLAIAAATEPSVYSKVGKLVGNRVFIDENEVHEFLGVPFAKAPIGSLRFKKPQPLPSTISAVRDSTKFAPTCVQMRHITEAINPLLNVDEDHKTSEDCLYLNVYVPVTNETFLPVMVWIPGEGFDFADARQFNGSYMAAIGKVIVVTVQYRVGVFGFLKIDGFAPGNMGLWDQVEALRWVKNNAKVFGGDPNKITVFGRFTGSMSISLLLTSPTILHQHLFRRAILMSGVAVGSWVFDNNAVEKSNHLMEMVGCQKNAECLKNIDPQELLVQSSYGWRPTIDYDFTVDEPLGALRKGQFTVGVSEMLLGTNEAEGTLCLLTHFATKSKYYPKFIKNKLSKEDFLEMVKMDLSMFLGSTEPMDWLHEQLLSYRLSSPKVSLEKEYINFCSSLLIKSPMERFANLLSNEIIIPTYTYNLNYRPSFSKQPSSIKTAAHGDDVLLLFGLANTEHEVALEDHLIAESLIEAFALFASKGRIVLNTTNDPSIDFARVAFNPTSNIKISKLSNATIVDSINSCHFKRNAETLLGLMQTHPDWSHIYNFSS